MFKKLTQQISPGSQRTFSTAAWPSYSDATHGPPEHRTHFKVVFASKWLKSSSSSSSFLSLSSFFSFFSSPPDFWRRRDTRQLEISLKWAQKLVISENRASQIDRSWDYSPESMSSMARMSTKNTANLFSWFMMCLKEYSRDLKRISKYFKSFAAH